MKQLELAKQSAIQLGGTITNNDVGFITSFDSSDTANNYALYGNDNLDELTAEPQDRCAVVVTIESLM